MPIVHTIPSGQTTTPNMGAGYSGGVVSFEFFNAGGAPVIPVGVPRVFRTGGSVEVEVPQFARNEWRFNGLTTFVRVDLTGLTGFSSYRATVWRTEHDVLTIPDGAFVGLRAMTTQGYNEANVKNGLQFYLQYSLPQLAANTAHKILFTTGAKRVLVKSRELYALGQFVSLQIYKQPTAPTPGGVVVPIQNYNDVNPVASTCQVRGGVTTTSDGTPWGDAQRLFGAATVGQRTGSGLTPGGDRELKENSSYLVVVRNTDSGGSSTADADYSLSWYEGTPDLPLTL